MKNKYTPGPWQMCLPEHGRPHHISVFVDGNKAQLATVDFGHLRTAINLLNAKEGKDIDFDVSYEAEEANARLIAAAPDLLDSLQDMVAFFEGIERYEGALIDYESSRQYNVAIERIKKAKGE